jgi:histidinol-phosphate aminotransferase
MPGQDTKKPLVAEHVETLKPYVAGKPIEELRRERGLTGPIIKLASNENPLGPSPRAMAAIQGALHEGHLYPDPRAYELRQALSQHLGVDADRIVVGNGSDQLMYLLVRTFTLGQEDHGVYSQYAFFAYWLNLHSNGLQYTAVPMGEDLTHDLEAMAEAVTPQTRFVFIANPNNPTGTHISREALEGFLDKMAALPDPPIVAMDEAYYEFADAPDYPDSLQLHERYPRLVTFRTFSKCYGLASVRIGYAVFADPQMAAYLNRVRKPFNANRLGQIAATAAIQDQEFVTRYLALNRQERARLTRELEALGAQVYPSQANFVLCKFGRPGAELYDALLDHGVITRPVVNYGLPQCLRISIGTAQENDRLLEALRKVLDV